MVMPGKCPDVKGQLNFNINKFVGNWTQTMRYPAAFEEDSKCNVATYEVTGNNTVLLTDSYTSVITGDKASVLISSVSDPDDPTVTHTMFPLTPYNVTSTCWILGTDYKIYAVSYCCTEKNGNIIQYSWAVKKANASVESAMEKAYEVIDRNNVERMYYQMVDQNACTN